ncbi:UDP-N-acetylmuramoyl-tripeptide--D-alanyl-D-alanine ligase [Cohnella nanjingensis]|uniref:UDP-N-acetylmuramoyl-tripeptide--D-alanyl-D-alanine ligase n=1 Tax=Cohnella nanjingensis TaxID=1387779 RepID=A0A7X0RSH5_9BACL|nr:UDP-N-acetylmuramoyl-tripeptide--D-alanyl-D-alanine ligase [Cohnella nanjingensis]MBB6672688.1 UDP-N-acetylmuramoyl-tripeptide--D-alanyl-D-alanine ligase [Cohnella nanjingensis]
MIRRTLSQIATMLKVQEPVSTREADTVIRGVSIDTRTLQPGQLYVPIVGDRFDGHAFADQAIAQGAAAVLWNRETPHPPTDRVPVLLVEDTLSAIQLLAMSYRAQLRAKIIAVTGSNGKTSTKDMLAGVLSERYATQKTSGNLNNHLGVPLTLLSLAEETEMAVVEMGMSGLGEIGLLSSIAMPDAAIVTNVGDAHLGDLGSKANILQAKLEIAQGLRQGGLLIYNGDDPLLSGALEGKEGPYEKVSFGMSRRNDYYPLSFALYASGTTFALDDGDELTTLTIPAVGRHQLENAMAAVAAAVRVGMMDLAQIKAGFHKVELTGMRNEIVRIGSVQILNDTYKSNPASAKASLAALSAVAGDKTRIAVLGDMQDLGDQAIDLHREIGACAAAHADYLFAYGPLSAYLAEEAGKRMKPSRVFHDIDKQAMIGRIRDVLRPDAFLLVKASREMKLEDVVTALSEGQVQP